MRESLEEFLKKPPAKILEKILEKMSVQISEEIFYGIPAGWNAGGLPREISGRLRGEISEEITAGVIIHSWDSWWIFGGFFVEILSEIPRRVTSGISKEFVEFLKNPRWNFS